MQQNAPGYAFCNAKAPKIKVYPTLPAAPWRVVHNEQMSASVTLTKRGGTLEIVIKRNIDTAI